MKLFYLKDNKSIVINDKSMPMENLIKNIDLRNETHKFLKSIEGLEEKGFTIEDVFYCEDLPMYIFIRPNIAFWIKNIISAINIIESLSDEKEIKEVVTDDYYVDLICKKVFSISTVFVPEKTQVHSKGHKLEEIRRYAIGIKNYIKFRTRGLNKQNLIMLTQAASISKLSNGKGYYDSKYGGLQEQLKKDYNILNLEYLHNKSFIEKSLNYKSDFVPFEFCIIFKRLLNNKLLKNKLIKDNFHKLSLFKYKVLNNDISSLFLEFMNTSGRNACMSFLKEELYLEKLMKRLKIKKCVVIDEGDRGRCLIASGNILGIDTYALQHGMISKGSYSYDVCLENSKLIVPKVTFLWGEKFKDMLLENTNIYNKENLYVVGQPRTDYLKSYEAPKGNKERINILFISQYMDDLVYPAGEILFDSIKNLNKDFELIIKLHPSDHMYSEYYNKQINKYKLQDNVRIAQIDEDLYELLEASNVVISVHSTVIMEATIMNKPSICIRLDKYDDVCNFVYDRISLGARNYLNLKSILENYEESFDKDYFKRLEEYVYKNFYKIDGKVLERMRNKISN